MRGAAASFGAVRARFLIPAGLLALLGGAACHSDRTSLPTEPASREAVSSTAEDPGVPRMPIVRIPRRGTAAPSPTMTPSAPPSFSTPTPTPIVPPTPSMTPTAVPAAISIRLRGINWQWDFYGAGLTGGGASITLRSGQSYEIEFFNDGPPDSSSHTFSGIAPLGLSAVSVAPGESLTRTFTPRQTGTFEFACTNSACGVGHDGMTGNISVVP